MTFRPLDILLDYAASPDADVRANAAAALGEMTDPRAQQKVVDLLGDPDRRVREAAFSSHLSHPAPTGFLARFSAARRLRTHSADLVGRRAVGPSIAGVGFAVVFALAAYLLLTGLVSRTLENAVWDSIIFAAITAAIGAAFAVVAAAASRPIAHYRHLLSGLSVELLWTVIIGALPAFALGTLVAVSILPPPTETGVGVSATVEDEVKTAGFIWHLLFMSGAILLAMLAARLAAAIAARSLPAGGARAVAAGLAAFMFGWFALWLLLLPWQAGARAGGGIDAGLVGRIGLASFVGLGAFAATLGFVESVGVRLHTPLNQRWLMRAGAVLLAAPGLFSVTHLALALPTQPRTIDMIDWVETERVHAPQMVYFNLPVDANVMVELSPSSLSEEERSASIRRDQYGPPFADRQTIKNILNGTTSIGTLTTSAFAATDQGEEFWMEQYYAEPKLSPEARRILEHWAKTAPETMASPDPYDTSGSSTAIPFAPPVMDYAAEPAPYDPSYPAQPYDPSYPPPPATPEDPSTTPASDTKKTWASMSGDTLAEIPALIEGDVLHRTAWDAMARLAKGEDGSYSGAVQAGRLEVCVKDARTDAGCDTNETFDSLFIALGERAIESWPLVGRARVQAEVRLTVLTDADKDVYAAAANAAVALQKSNATKVENQDSLLVALTNVSQSTNCASAVYLRPGDVVLRRRTPDKPKAERPGEPSLPAESSTFVIKRYHNTYDGESPECATPAKGQVSEIPLGEGADIFGHISAALQLGALSANTKDDPAERDQLARLIAAGLATQPPTVATNGAYTLALTTPAQLDQYKSEEMAKFRPVSVLACRQDGLDFVVGGPAEKVAKSLADRSYMMTSAPLGDTIVYLGPVWNKAWVELMLKREGSGWATSSDAESCGTIPLPPELIYGPVPPEFKLQGARQMLANDTGLLGIPFEVYGSHQGEDFWTSQYYEMLDGKPITTEARKALEYWIGLVEVMVRDRASGRIPRPSFGRDHEDYGNDGSCNDPRFTTASLPEIRLNDATDCRAAWDRGEISLLPE